ncbi:hypothetical protein [Chlamydia pecorum]|uniref:hypothetical protein n=1 Tax=Chlamydia pecorum TaxID=85991 RepID=UPI0035257FB3
MFLLATVALVGALFQFPMSTVIPIFATGGMFVFSVSMMSFICGNPVFLNTIRNPTGNLKSERLENFKKENFTPCENSPENPQSCCDLQAETEDKENLCS